MVARSKTGEKVHGIPPHECPWLSLSHLFNEGPVEGGGAVYINKRGEGCDKVAMKTTKGTPKGTPKGQSKVLESLTELLREECGSFDVVCTMN